MPPRDAVETGAQAPSGPDVAAQRRHAIVEALAPPLAALLAGLAPGPVWLVSCRGARLQSDGRLHLGRTRTEALDGADPLPRLNEAGGVPLCRAFLRLAALPAEPAGRVIRYCLALSLEEGDSVLQAGYVSLRRGGA
jgi:hypothetical protein